MPGLANEGTRSGGRKSQFRYLSSNSHDVNAPKTAAMTFSKRGKMICDRIRARFPFLPLRGMVDKSLGSVMDINLKHERGKIRSHFLKILNVE